MYLCMYMYMSCDARAFGDFLREIFLFLVEPRCSTNCILLLEKVIGTRKIMAS